MTCLPIGRQLKRFGRALSKMIPTSSKLSIWTKHRCENDKENLVPSSNESSWYSDRSDLSSIWRSPSRNLSPRVPKQFDHSDLVNQLFYKNYFEDETNLASSSSSGYESFADQTRTDVTSSLNQPIPYWPFQSSNDDFVSDFSSDFNLDDLLSLTPTNSERDAYHDDIRREFEMNGKTEELNTSFSPSQCSTPMTGRKSQQWEQQNGFHYQEFVPSNARPKPNFSPPSNRKIRKKVKPNKKSLVDHCVFCKNNGESEINYRSHTTKDAYGKVVCPKLRSYKCPICGEKDDKAHTVKYCPKRPIITLEDTKKKMFKI